MAHTITIHDEGNGEPNSYWVEFDGNTKPQKTTVHGATKDDNDSIKQTSNGYRVEGTVYGGRDAYQYYGKRLGMAFKYPDRIRIKINDQNWQTSNKFGEAKQWSGGGSGGGGSGGGGSDDSGSSGSSSSDTEGMHTIAIDDAGNGEGNNYKIVFEQKPKKVAVHGATVNESDNIYETGNGNWAVQGRVYGGRDAYAYNGARTRHVIEYPDRVEFKINDRDWQSASDFDVTQRSDWPGEGGGGDSGGGSGGGGSSPPSGGGPVQRHGIRFKKVLHAVDDLGMDPNGNEPIDGKLNDAAADYTLIVFPNGAFAKHKKTVHEGLQNFGLCGHDETRFVAPKGFNQKFVVIDRGMNTLFENINVDLRANNATPGLHLGAQDGLDVRNVRYRGQGIHPDSTPRGKGSGNPEVTNALTVHMRAPDGTGQVKNVTAHNKGLMGAYNTGEGRVGIFTGRANKGTLTIKDCNFEGFPNNGLYTSRTTGVVQVEGGRFQNNDISQVRLGGKGSYVRNARIEVDMGESRSPNPNDALNTRGVRFDGPVPKEHGAKARDCTIRIAKTPHSGGGVVANQDTGAFGVHNVRIRIDTDGVRGVVGKSPCGIGDRNPPPKPHAATIKNVTIIGKGGGAEAVRLVDRPDSTIDQLCVSCDGQNHSGVRCTGSSGTQVTNSNVNVDGKPVKGADTKNLTTDKNCR